MLLKESVKTSEHNKKRGKFTRLLSDYSHVRAKRKIDIWGLGSFIDGIFLFQIRFEPLSIIYSDSEEDSFCSFKFAFQAASLDLLSLNLFLYFALKASI